MAEIITPKNILEDVMKDLLRSPPFKFFQSRLQKVLFYISLVMSGLGILFFLLYSIAPWSPTLQPWWAIFAVLFVLLAQLSVIVELFVSALSSIRFIFHPEKTLFEPVIVSFNDELDLIAQLVQKFERHHLQYALDRITLVATQLRTRIALLVGALDKIGVIPLGIGAAFSLHKLFEALKSLGPQKTNEQLTSSALSIMIGLSIGLVFLYLSALGLLGRAQRIDHVCLVLRHAVQAKKLADSSLDSDTPQPSPTLLANPGPP